MPPGPGGQPYLRLRGGRRIKFTGASGGFLRFFQWNPANSGTPVKLVSLHSDGGTAKWQQMNGGNPNYSFVDIATVIDPLAASKAIACAGVRNKLFMHNGLGTRDGDGSRPALLSWDGTTVRYVGLDAFLSGANPIASLTAGAGLNTILSSVSIWVGLFNSTTQHYSNAVFAGTLSRPGTGTISVTGLTALSTVSNNLTEAGELYYVFYATIDGGKTAYLILDSTLAGPYKVAVGTASTTLSISALSQMGFVLDLTQERPIENYPPRPMTALTYANGRCYGILTGGGTGDVNHLPDQDGNYYTDFSYAGRAGDYGAIAWSAAADDQQDRDFVGVPEESWPLRNRKYPPNGEPAIMMDSAPGGSQVLVLTAHGTFLLSEAADGVHQWTTVSDRDGIVNPNVYVRTPRGPIWLTSERRLVMLDAQTLQLRSISGDFDEFLGRDYLSNPVGTTSDYLLDPYHGIDYYEIWRVDGSSVVYDFALGGMAYEKTGLGLGGIGVAASLRDFSGAWHHILAGQHIYGQEADPFTGLISTRDELTSGVFTEINGDYVSQWMAYGDPRDRKRLTDFDVIADGEVSDALGARPVTFSYFVDFDTEEAAIDLDKTPQSQNDQDHNYKGRFRTGNGFWFKFRVRLSGHSADGNTTYPEAISSTGEIPPNFYGCVYQAAPTIALTGNRP